MRIRKKKRIKIGSIEYNRLFDSCWIYNSKAKSDNIFEFQEDITIMPASGYLMIGVRNMDIYYPLSIKNV